MRVRFGRFVLDRESRELLRGHAPVALSPKAFDLLALLVAHRPKAMSKADLLEQLWPGTFVVEKNLANLVGEIREALGDDPSEPRFIRTVHRFGYAFRDAAAGADADAPSNAGGLLSFSLKWAGGRATLGDGEHLIGRDPDAEVFVNQAGVSRRHARIVIAGGRAALDDLGSKNGTSIGGRRVDGPTPVSDGDTIRIGSVSLTLRVRERPASTRTERA
jgi:DNA-binding winged helix-turn-helix (wHTH) protein